MLIFKNARNYSDDKTGRKSLKITDQTIFSSYGELVQIFEVRTSRRVCHVGWRGEIPGRKSQELIQSSLELLRN